MTGVGRQVIESIVIAAVKRNLEFSGKGSAASEKFSDTVSAESIVFGDGGLDSIGLVNLIVDLEADLSAGPESGGAGLTVTLADERAMSRSSSPFRTVSTLVDFIIETAKTE